MKGQINNFLRNGALAALVASALLLAGCGSDAIEGKYTVERKMMGMDVGTSKAELDEDFIILDERKFEVAEWVRDGDNIVARNAKGEAIINAKVVDDGRVLIIDEKKGLSVFTFTRI